MPHLIRSIVNEYQLGDLGYLGEILVRRVLRGLDPRTLALCAGEILTPWTQMNPCALGVAQSMKITVNDNMMWRHFCSTAREQRIANLTAQYLDRPKGSENRSLQL